MAEKFDNPNYNPEAGMKYLATHFEMFKPEVVKAMIKAGILNAARNARDGFNAKFKVGDKVVFKANGHRGEVKKIDGGKIGVRWAFSSSVEWHKEDELQKLANSVRNAKFKVGDRVKVTWNPDGQKKGIVGKTGELLRISSEGTALVEIDGNEYFTDRAYLKIANSVLSINSSAGDRGRKALSEGWGHGRLVTWEKEVEEGKRGAEKIRKDIRDLESTLPQVKGTEWFERTKDAIVFMKEFAAKHGIRINSVCSANARRVRVLKAERLVPDRLVGQIVEVVGGRGDDVFIKDPKFPRLNIPTLLKKGEYEVVNSVSSCNSSALEKLIADGDNGKWDRLAWMPKVIGKGSLYPDTMKISGELGYDQEAKIREAWKSGKYNSVIFYKHGTKKGEVAVNACVVRTTNAVVAKALNAMGRDKQDAASVEMWIGVFDNFLSSQAPKFKDKERAKAMGEKIIKDIEKSLGSEGGKVQLQKMGWTVQKMRDALAKALNAVSNAWADAPDAATAKRDIEQTVRKATEIAKKQSGAKATYKMTPNDYYWCGYIDLTFNTEEEAKKYNPYYLFDELGDNKSILPKWSWAISAFNYQKTGKVVRIFVGTLNT